MAAGQIDSAPFLRVVPAAAKGNLSLRALCGFCACYTWDTRLCLHK